MGSPKVRCPGCGAENPATSVCAYCRASAMLDGEGASLLPSDLRCPRCAARPPLRGLLHDGIRADFCLVCHGVWFGTGLLDAAVRAAALRPPREGEAAEGPAHGAVEPVRYARCPRCKGGMMRVPFAQKPLVLVDRCPAHGDWCDGGELGQLKAVARSRGPEEALGPRAVRRVGRQPSDAAAMDSPLGGRCFAGESIVPPEVSRADAGRGRYDPRDARPEDIFDVLWRLFTER